MWRTNPENIQQSVCLKVWAVRRDRVRERYSLVFAVCVRETDSARREKECCSQPFGAPRFALRKHFADAALWELYGTESVLRARVV